MAVRLYMFGGEAVTPKPDDCKVISWTWTEAIEGVRYKMVKSTQSFDTYEEATTFIAGQSSGNYNVVSFSPVVSPVPLEGLNGFNPVYDSQIKTLVGTETPAQVRIFEYVKSV
jgi:hypothetical protein